MKGGVLVGVFSVSLGNPTSSRQELELSYLGRECER